MRRFFSPIISAVGKAAATVWLGAMGLTLICSEAQAQTPPKNLTYPLGWTQCAGEGGDCWFPDTVRDVAYGTKGRYIYLLAVKDYVKCTNGEFWDTDPKPGESKACYVYNGPSRLAKASIQAAENGTVTIKGPGTVWFGADGQFVPKNISQDDSASTSVACTSSNFGGDPNQGRPKFCAVSP